MSMCSINILSVFSVSQATKDKYIYIQKREFQRVSPFIGVFMLLIQIKSLNIKVVWMI